jgi:addiction module HigA family antidote
MGNYVCARPIHPGELLKEEVEYRGISQSKLAAQMGMSYKALNDILNERRPLTPTTAMLFNAALGVEPGMLMRMQLDYNMREINSDQTFAKRLAEVRKLAATVTL